MNESLVHTAVVDHAADFNGWRKEARRLLNQHIDPAEIIWQIAGDSVDLFACDDSTTSADANHGLHPNTAPFHVPRNFVTLAQRVVCHRDANRFALLYRVLWRLTHNEAGLLERVSDDDVHKLNALAKAVSRDRHKMTAFVRFRKTPGCEREHYSAWFEPSHNILRLTSDFFCKRFSTMDWSIYTPEGSAHWNRSELVFGPAGTRNDIPDGEVMEDVWRVYFANIFNPARLRLDAMQSEMPVKYWKNLPEAPIIAALVHDAGRRTSNMIDAAPTSAPRFAEAALHHRDETSATEPAHAPAHAPALAPVLSLEQLRRDSKNCDRCAHACEATQTVFGYGPASAHIMVVGEQPGDIEDVRGRPFVGPSGKLLRSILAELSVDQSEMYFTNAVKHFKYTVRGKRRIHKSPSANDIEQCRRWLFAELSVVKPSLVIALGSSSARSLLGRTVSMQDERGTVQPFANGSWLLVTHHPARVLRANSQSESKRLKEQLRKDLQVALNRRGSLSQLALA